MTLVGRAWRKVRNRERLRRAARVARSQMPGLITRIAPSDKMLNRSDPGQYFIAGHAALEAVERALVAAGIDAPSKVLDLACGHGRVLRYFRARWPLADITASELMPGAVEFCADAFGVTPLPSSDPLWETDFGGPYDLVWSGSLFTHFDAPYWEPSLDHVRKLLAPGGVYVFTAQGEPSLAFLSGSGEYPILDRVLPANYGLPKGRADAVVAAAQQTGFGFAHYEGAEGNPYGASISLPAWVRERTQQAGLRVVTHEVGGWGGHQDVWTVTPAA